MPVRFRCSSHVLSGQSPADDRMVVMLHPATTQFDVIEAGGIPGLSDDTVMCKHRVHITRDLTRVTAQMAADKEAVGLSRVHMYQSKCNPNEIIAYYALKHMRCRLTKPVTCRAVRYRMRAVRRWKWSFYRVYVFVLFELFNMIISSSCVQISININ